MACDEVGSNPFFPIIVVIGIHRVIATVGKCPMRCLLNGLAEFLRWNGVKFKINVLVASSRFGQWRELYAQQFGQGFAVNDGAEVCTIVPEYDLKPLPRVFPFTRQFNRDMDVIA